MGAKGFYLPQDGHLVQLFEPLDHTAGGSSLVVRMENYSHLSIIVSYGTSPRAAGVIFIESCDDMTPTTHTEIAFTCYKCILDFEGALGDVMGAAVACTAAVGLVPTVVANTMYVIELDDDQLVSGHIGFRMRMAAPSAASVLSAIGILSGARYGMDQSPTVIA